MNDVLRTASQQCQQRLQINQVIGNAGIGERISDK